MRTIERNGESILEQKLLTPTSRDNGIKIDVVVVIVVVVVVVVVIKVRQDVMTSESF